MKLYKIRCKGMTDSHGNAYVVAENSHKAYQLLRQHLDDEQLGFDKEREFDQAILLADDAECPPCGRKLFMQGGHSASRATERADTEEKENG